MRFPLPARPVAAIVLALAVSACATHVPPAEQAAAERGRDLAIAQCAGCHNVALTGASPYRAAPEFRALRGSWTGPALQLRLERSPIHDSVDMASRALAAEQAASLAAFIDSVRAGRPPRGRPLRAGFCNPTLWC